VGGWGHLRAGAAGVVVDADPVRRRELQVVLETLGVAGKLVERLLQIDRLIPHEI
jgi:hypothetical protein